MGRRSQEKRTGKTYKERIKKPTGNKKYDIGNELREEEKARKKEAQMKRLTAYLFRTGKLKLAEGSAVKRGYVD
jgi:uncharacterized Rmd1/YagE family protein